MKDADLKFFLESDNFALDVSKSALIIKNLSVESVGTGVVDEAQEG